MYAKPRHALAFRLERRPTQAWWRRPGPNKTRLPRGWDPDVATPVQPAGPRSISFDRKQTHPAIAGEIWWSPPQV